MVDIKTIRRQNIFLSYKRDSYTFRAITLVLFSVIYLIIMFDLLFVFSQYYLIIWAASSALLTVIIYFIFIMMKDIIHMNSVMSRNIKAIKRMSDENSLRDKLFG